MQIGDFAKICGTKVSVLRHYDKEGLLVPDVVDAFTGYRYYSETQVPVFMRISALKKAGFSLVEIKQILSSMQNDEQILALFAAKRKELLQTVSDLRAAENMIFKDKNDMTVRFFQKDGRTYAQSDAFEVSQQNAKREEFARILLRDGYQRVSGFAVCGEKETSEARLTCEAVKLSDTPAPLFENTDIAFEDDPAAVGKWQIIGEYAVKEDFYGNICPTEFTAKEICLLPGGAPYWCYSWSKGRLICRFGDVSSVNTYHIEDWGGQRYMFVDFKSYEYRRGGRETVLVLRQMDQRAYTADELARKDDMDMPFVEDTEVLGEWISVDICESESAFDPSLPPKRGLFFSSVTFRENGEVISVYGGKEIRGGHLQSWTKGCVLRKWNSTACGYRIRVIGGKEYLFMEWKSGDYVYGGMDPNYYVFTRL